MLQGRTLCELAAELTRQAESKKDYLAPIEALRYEPSREHGVVLKGVNGGMPLRATAHAQMAEVLGVPKAYYDRMLRDAPDLLAASANRWITGAPVLPDCEGGATPLAGKKRLVRTLDGQVRAVLSDSFRPLDNLDLAEAVLPALSALNAKVESCEVTESRLYLKAVTDRVSGEVKKGDVVQAGLVVSNSEIGLGTLSVEELDYRLVCLNGMIGASAVRKTHVGRSASRGMDALEEAREYFRTETRAADDRAFFLKVKDTVGMMFEPDRFNRRLDKYREAAGQAITADPVQVVEVTAKRLGLTDGERGSVLAHLVRGADLSKWGLSNAITRAAQDVTDYDRSTQMEAMGGAVIELAAQSWKSIAEAKTVATAV